MPATTKNLTHTLGYLLVSRQINAQPFPATPIELCDSVLNFQQVVITKNSMHFLNALHTLPRQEKRRMERTKPKYHIKINASVSEYDSKHDYCNMASCQPNTLRRCMRCQLGESSPDSVPKMNANPNIVE